MPGQASHDVIEDATTNGRSRITCQSCQTAGQRSSTAVRLDWMSDMQWNEAKKAFLRSHPCPQPRTLA